MDDQSEDLVNECEFDFLPAEILVKICDYLAPHEHGNLAKATNNYIIYDYFDEKYFQWDRKDAIYSFRNQILNDAHRRTNEEAFEIFKQYVNQYWYHVEDGNDLIEVSSQFFDHAKLGSDIGKFPHRYEDILRQEYRYSVDDSIHDYLNDVFIAQNTQQDISGINYVERDRDGGISYGFTLDRDDFGRPDHIWGINRPRWNFRGDSHDTIRAMRANQTDWAEAHINAKERDIWLLMNEWDVVAPITTSTDRHDDVSLGLKWLFGDEDQERKKKQILDNIDLIAMMRKALDVDQ